MLRTPLSLLAEKRPAATDTTSTGCRATAMRSLSDDDGLCAAATPSIRSSGAGLTELFTALQRSPQNLA